MTESLPSLPIIPVLSKPTDDWLINPSQFNATVYRGVDDREIVLTNGLISRTWRLEPNCATAWTEHSRR